MRGGIFSPSDMQEIESHGLRLEEVARQLRLFQSPPVHLKLHRPCTPGDGVRVLSDAEARSFSRLFDQQKGAYDCIKFVPASGAATRMFRVPLKFLKEKQSLSFQSLAMDAQCGNQEAMAVRQFFEGLRSFAFTTDLKAVILSTGTSLEVLEKDNSLKEILEFLLTERGLHLAALPKGLIPFHRYSNEIRTAFEEHLVEAALYGANRNDICKLHLTVSEEHLQRFQSLLKKIRPSYEKRYGVSYRVEFSLQKKSTDTIAVDLSNHPFRQKDGRLLFRPGGHGALIENLNDLEGDLVFIKNIDNVVPDRLKKDTARWKKVLAGHLIHLQREMFRILSLLTGNRLSRDRLDNALRFATEELHIELSANAGRDAPEQQRKNLLKKLNRPIRVCGMVKNTGEPGGGPFWVIDRDGTRSCQIVETPQIDLASQDQERIAAASTHFNPVDLVCGLKDWKGNPFDLRQFVDADAVFITTKSRGGMDLKALELPGLWNGAMASWITVFVEVPSTTFNPVKTINDLLREEHQPL